MVRYLGKQTRRARIFYSPSLRTVSKALKFDQVYEICIWTNVLFSVFLLYLPQQGDHVCSPSVGPESTLAFWRVFLCYCRDEPIQQDASLQWRAELFLGSLNSDFSHCFGFFLF